MLQSKSKTCQSKLCYWKLLPLQYDPAGVCENHSRGLGAKSGVHPAFFHRELFHPLVIQEIHLLEKLPVRALWGYLLLHHGAEDVFICQMVSCSCGIQCPAQNQVWKSVQSIKSTQTVSIHI